MALFSQSTGGAGQLELRQQTKVLPVLGLLLLLGQASSNVLSCLLLNTAFSLPKQGTRPGHTGNHVARLKALLTVAPDQSTQHMLPSAAEQTSPDPEATAHSGLTWAPRQGAA